MKANSYLLFFFLIAVVSLNSCEKNNNPIVDFYITTSQSNKYDKLNTTFTHIRTFELGEDSIISIGPFPILEQTDLEFITDGNQEPVYLGTSEMGLGKITGFDFGFSYSSTIEKSGEVYDLLNPEVYQSHFGACDIMFQEKETKTIIFEIDIDKSIIELNSGELKFIAQINVRLED